MIKLPNMIRFPKIHPNKVMTSTEASLACVFFPFSLNKTHLENYY